MATSNIVLTNGTFRRLRPLRDVVGPSPIKTTALLAFLFLGLIWGSNFSIVKVALRDFPELAFNAMRMIVASSVWTSTGLVMCAWNPAACARPTCFGPL